jgi:molybdopterin-guanine dinucleotide biosynthesis protein A
MLGLIRETAEATGLKLRVIRRDLVARCGPLGGIYSGLKTTRAQSVIFIACDMPFITPGIIEKLRKASVLHPNRAILLRAVAKLTFPMLLPVEALPIVQSQIETGDLSIQSLGKRLRGSVIDAPRKWMPCLQNINTPRDLEFARRRLSKIGRTSSRVPEIKRKQPC